MNPYLNTSIDDRAFDWGRGRGFCEVARGGPKTHGQLIGAGSANWQFAPFLQSLTDRQSRASSIRLSSSEWLCLGSCANCQFALPAPISYQKTTAVEKTSEIGGMTSHTGLPLRSFANRFIFSEGHNRLRNGRGGGEAMSQNLYKY
jgi:hypothetical protein